MDAFARKTISHIILALFVLSILFTLPTVFRLFLILGFYIVVPNESTLTLVGIVFAIITAIIIYHSERRESYKREVREQIRILSMLKSELIILKGEKTELYGGGVTSGNLDWYRANIFNNQVVGLIHSINKLSFQNYIHLLDASMCRVINFPKLVRTLSWLNDKIYTINAVVEDWKVKKINTSQVIVDVIEESLQIIEVIKHQIDRQVKPLRKYLAEDR